MHLIAIEREYCLIFGNGFFEPLLRTQHLGFGIMRKRRRGKSRYGSIGERFRSCEIVSGRAGHFVEHPRRQLPRQEALYLFLTGVECQCALMERDLVSVIAGCRHVS